MLIQVSSDVDLLDADGNIVDQLHVNDEENWSVTKYDAEIRFEIVNAYIGGCFHELIRWETH